MIKTYVQTNDITEEKLVECLGKKYYQDFWTSRPPPHDTGLSRADLRAEMQCHQGERLAYFNRMLRRLRDRGFIMVTEHRWEINGLFLAADTIQLKMTMMTTKPPTQKLIKGWSSWEKLLTVEYLDARMLRASDNIIRVPPCPEHLTKLMDNW